MNIYEYLDKISKAHEKIQSKISVPKYSNSLPSQKLSTVQISLIELMERFEIISSNLIHDGIKILNQSICKTIIESDKEVRTNEIVEIVQKVSNDILKWEKRQADLMEVPEYREMVENENFLIAENEYLKEENILNSELKKRLCEKDETIKKLRKDLKTIRYKFSEFKGVIDRVVNDEVVKIKPPLKLTLKPCVKDSDIIFIHDCTCHLFVNSSIAKWRNLLSDEVRPFEIPLILDPGVTLVKLAFMLVELKEKGFIKNVRYKKVIEELKCFEFNGAAVTSKQLSNALADVEYKTSPVPLSLFNEN